MNTKLSTNRKFKRMFANILSILAILAIAFPATGSAYAQEPALPVGWHDGVAGIVNAAGCGAFGWTVDPDDPDRDLQVQILADGSPVATTTADLFREDLGECTGGTCGFGINLWGLISPGVEHLISAQAYDEETGTWVDLSGTPKAVTCWGYPEGFHDGNEGMVDPNSCTASGWAADPDNRDRDLRVQILADENVVVETTADLFREDLGACTGGTCGYSVGLWGLISPDIEHQILAQAFDEETGEWWNLESTPKSLTCFTPSPHFTVFPEWEWFDGLNWPDEATVSITVEGKPGCTTSKDSSGYFFNGNFGEGCNVEIGDTVTFDNGTTNRTHVVRNLAITAVNPGDNTITGVADKDTVVYVWPHDGWFEPLQAIANEENTWQVDFDDVGYDIQEGKSGRSEIRDDVGNATAVDWYVPNPHFTVFPEWEFFDGLDWPDGAIVTITVIDKPECETTQESWGGFFNGNFGEGCDVVVGDEVTFEYGETILAHTVQNLVVTNVDVATNAVGGTADPGAVIDVWPHETGQQLQATATDGNWQVDFTGQFDLAAGTCGRSQILVGANATAVDWCAPKPWLIAFPENEAVEGWEWPVGATVTLTIDNAPENFVQTGTAEVTTWGDPRTYVRFDFWEEYNLQIGDVVTFTDGTITRTHIVQNLSVTDVNADTDIVGGTANPATVVTLWPHGYDQVATIQTTAGEDGAWTGEFAPAGFNLVPGIGGRSEVGDEFGNWTAVNWGVYMDGWQQINDSGFGDSQKIGVPVLEVFQGQLYASAGKGINGAEVWRLANDGQWSQVSEPGFGNNLPYSMVIDLEVFKGRLYAGVGWAGENWIDPAGQMWRSHDGTNWEPVTTNGFGNDETIGITNFIVYKGMLYAGTGGINDTSAQIWRSSTGDGGSWEQVAPDGSGFTGNVTGFAAYKGVLYAAIEPPGGVGAPMQVWRSTNGSDWVPVTSDGFGIERNESTGGFAQFDGYLYLGTQNEDTGAQLWRTVDGMYWEQVIGNGFGDLNNIKIEALLVYGDFFYAATKNIGMGMQLWRSADGTNWEQVIADGFGDSGNFATLWNSAIAQYQGNLVIGTWNYTEGGEVWLYTP